MNSIDAQVALTCHPDTPSRAVQHINVSVGRREGWLALRYVIIGDIASIRLPRQADAARADNLWQSTCCELFMREKATAYREFNFSPSGQWAAYGFDDYRKGLTVLNFAEPPRAALVRENEGIDAPLCLAAFAPETGRGVEIMSLCAIIEELDGTKSYWALAHPPGRPDFHHADCFALTIPAVGGK